MKKDSNRHELMKDAIFWMRLESKACAWLDESDCQTMRGLWIDGFLPENVTDTKQGVDVAGKAWINKGRRDALRPHRFVVSIPQKMLHRRRDRFSLESFVLDQGQHTIQMKIGLGTQVA